MEKIFVEDEFIELNLGRIDFSHDSVFCIPNGENPTTQELKNHNFENVGSALVKCGDNTPQKVDVYKDTSNQLITIYFLIGDKEKLYTDASGKGLLVSKNNLEKIMKR